MDGPSLEAALLSRFNAGLSQRRWEAQQIGDKKPAHRLALRQYAAALQDAEGECSLPLYSVTGAYMPLLRFTHRLICHEHDLGFLALPAQNDSWLKMKISVDGRSLRGHSNVAFSISFDESSRSQSPAGCYTWAMANLNEPDLPSAPLWHEIGIDAAIAQMRATPLEIGLQAVQVDPYLCGDWKCLSYVVGFAPANSIDGESLICGWCNTDKQFLREGWRQGSPFARADEDNSRFVREISSLPISCARYDPMHGVNRLLDNSLHIIEQVGHSSSLARLLHAVCPGWGDDVSFRAVQTSAFFAGSAADQIITLYENDEQTIRRQHPDGTVEDLPAGEAVAQLTNACGEYYRFTRRRDPDNVAFDALQAARDDALAICHALNAELTASMHYMTTHFISYAHSDGSAYALLQEGAEHRHKFDRQTAANVFCGSLNGSGMLQQLLDQQDLHRLLLQRAPFMPPARVMGK
jgi:hypothetical protein